MPIETYYMFFNYIKYNRLKHVKNIPKEINFLFIHTSVKSK